MINTEQIFKELSAFIESDNELFFITNQSRVYL